MRLISGLFCAALVTALIATGVRADEYTKQTFLTFSGSVQLPGVTLPAGTYMFKLADPSGDRRALQIWDKEGSKLYTTLLTIPNDRMEAPDDPVVMFAETPADEPPAIKAWFYPGESIGQEFLYPKDQAMKIAKAAHQPVLATADEGATVGRIDERGNMTEQKNAQASKQEDQVPQPAATSTSTTSTASTSTASATTEDRAETNAQVRPDAATTESRRSARAAESNTTSSSQSTAATRPSQSAASARPAPADASGRPVGTSGTLPRTASQLQLVKLSSLLLLGGALAARRLRIRLAKAS